MSDQSEPGKGKSSASLFSLNESAALAFAEIAEYLELKGENPFKIKAYVKASRVLRDLEEDLDEISERGHLQSIPGVGKAIADKLEAFLETGTIPQLEELKLEIPQGLREIASLPGLGAKKTLLLHKELGVASLSELLLACQEERVEKVKGFSKKSQQKILDLAEKAAVAEVVFVKSRLEEWGARTLESVAGLEGLEQALVVGKVRRKEPSSDRLEILLLGSDPQVLEEALSSYLQQAATAGRREEGGWLVRHPSGCPVYFYVSSSLAGGAEILRRTGPESFVAAFAERATGFSQAGDETSFFAESGVGYVAPELRHRPDPWTLTALLEEAQIKGNLHAHSTWSDGQHSLPEMLTEAVHRNHAFYGVTDHSRSLVIANGLTIERLLAQGGEIESLRSGYPSLSVFKSVECDILEEGELDYPDEVLQTLDYVVAAVHSFFHLSRERMTERLLRGIAHPKVKVLAHPTGRKVGRREGYEADWETLFRACAAGRVALEINASPWRLDINEDLLELANGLGCLISINTDAHSIDEFDHLRHGVDMARRAALDPGRVVNTWSVDRLRSWFDE